MPGLERIALFTKEYPPHVYGGAGVHVEYLSRELARRVPVEIRCFGDQDVRDGNLRVRGYPMWKDVGEGGDPRHAGAVDAFARSLAMAKDRLDAEVVHCHTWYTDMAGLLASKLWGVPYALTIHSLEPLRPWKSEQLGRAYQLSLWMERTAIHEADAVVAVSEETRADVLRLFRIPSERVHVIHNGIDPDEYRRTEASDALSRRGVDPARPFVLFVGRIARQKGILHLVRAIQHLDPSLQVVLCAGAPDTPEILEEMTALVAEISKSRQGIFWIPEMLPRAEVIQFYSHAAVFCCPSVYEPFGIINLEAMACGTPVVASAVGGIKEVVVPGGTGILIEFERREDDFEPVEPERFQADLAAALNRVALDPALRARFGEAGRRRVEERFSWSAIAERTLALYRTLVQNRSA